MSATRSPLRVLLVEDDVLVATVANDFLQELGFRIIEAGTAKAAFEIFAPNPAGIDIAIIDVGLPDGRGDELAVKMRGQRGNLPIIMATGYGEADLSDELQAHPAFVVLNKPYDTGLLRGAFESLGLL